MNLRTFPTIALMPMVAATMLLAVPAANAQVPEPAADGNIFTPITQTVDDAKITIINARWIPASQVKFDDARSGFTPPPMFFAVDYRLGEPEVETRPLARRTESGPIVELIAPNGRRLRGNAIGQPQDGIYTRVWNNFYGVDPRWKDVRLEFTWQDPKTPANANGRFRETVEWANVPLPAAADQTLLLNLPQTTPNGTRLFLESAVIQTRPRQPEDKSLYLVGRWLPPENAPDLCAEIEERRGSSRDRQLTVEYNTGAPFQDRTHHIGVSPGKSFGLRDTTAGYFTASAAAPPPEAKTVTLRLEVVSHAPSLADPQWTKRFQFTVPLTGLTLPLTAKKARDIPLNGEPVAESQLGEARLLLMQPRFKPDRGFDTIDLLHNSFV